MVHSVCSDIPYYFAIILFFAVFVNYFFDLGDPGKLSARKVYHVLMSMKNTSL